nr:RNA-binding protein [Rhodovibrio salinarum]
MWEIASDVSAQPTGGRPQTDGTDRAAAEDSATAPQPKGPQRRCIASGEVDDKARLLRFGVGPDGQIVPDPGEDLPGRGLWLRPRPDMIDKARRKRLFARAARAQVTVPDDLADQVAHLLRRRCLDRIGLARAAGDVVAGFEKVRTLLKRDAAGVLLQAADTAADSRDKVRRVAVAVRPDLPVIEGFDSAELGRMIGRERSMHLALRRGGHADRLLLDAWRYQAFAPAPFALDRADDAASSVDRACGSDGPSGAPRDVEAARGTNGP